MKESVQLNTLPYKPFNFFKLDSKLNKEKIQQKRKQQQQKNTLHVFQEKVPNLLFARECDEIMNNYKDHYNINRKFSIFYENKYVSDARQFQNQEENQSSKPIKDMASLHLKRSQSTNIFPLNQNNHTFKNNKILIQSVRNIMKPIKTNQYISKDGLIKGVFMNSVSRKRNQQEFVKQTAKQIFPKTNKTSNFRIIQNGIKSLELKKNKSLKIQQKQNSESKLKINITRKRHLKKIFRKNILIIIQKLKKMKITFNEVIEKGLFDFSIPYKFGDDIFHAVKEGNQPKVFRILMQNRISIFGRDPTGKTALMWACIRGHQKIVQLLLSNGVDSHSKDFNDKTAFYFAIKYDKLQCVKTLFFFSEYQESDIQFLELSNQMRRVTRVGFSQQQFLMNFQSINKKKQLFQQKYKLLFGS